MQLNQIRKGSGNYLVLVHGALTDGAMWLPHMAYLAAHFEVVSISLRHFERPEEGSFGLNSHADDLGKVISALLEEKPVSVVAWSYGADVVLNMLAKQAMPLAKVFLYEPGYPGCVKEEAMGAWLEDANAIFGAVFEHFGHGHLEQAVEALIDGTGNRPGYFQAQPDDVKALQLSKAFTLAQQLHQQEQPQLDPQRVAQIETPIILGHGSATRDMFKLVTRHTAATSERFQLLEAAGQGHMLPQADPEAFSRMVVEALAAPAQEGCKAPI
ncbi:alpha/beta fold hydrolase [Gallaecimonas xiamenensis]|nr:alpha/beta hydrolase [Gallaecimonas xiamenensis]